MCSWKNPTHFPPMLPRLHFCILHISRGRAGQLPLLLRVEWNRTHSLTKQVKTQHIKKKPNPALFSFKPCFLSLKSWPLYLFQGPLVTVYVSKLDHGASTTIYRFSLNASIPSPWKMCSTEREVSSFQVWEQEKSQPDYIGNNSSPTKAAYN